jgi:hypothetical protein
MIQYKLLSNTKWLLKICHMTKTVVIVTAIVYCYPVRILAYDQFEENKKESHNMEPFKNSLTNPHMMVEALVNNNHPPKIENGGHRLPEFNKNFDWPEYSRVWKAIPIVVNHAEGCWPELVSHLDDERYCMTIKSMSSHPHNFSVGDMCRDIIARNLSEAYYQNLKPELEIIYARFRRPEIADDKKKLKAWCEERSKKKLYELQIEMCQWAIKELNKHNISRVTYQSESDWITAIESEIESLRKSKQAVPFRGFGVEEYMRYNSDKPEEILEKQNLDK